MKSFKKRCCELYTDTGYCSKPILLRHMKFQVRRAYRVLNKKNLATINMPSPSIEDSLSHLLEGKKRTVDKLWQDFFSDPSQWWDHRMEKCNTRYPDFKNKETQEGLFLDSKLKPAWVEAELAALAQGTVQLNIFSWNKRLAKYVKAGQYEKTLQLFDKMQQDGISPDEFTFVPVLNACASLGILQEGRRIHAQIIQTCCESNMYIASTLVDMYAKCGSIEDAQRVFKKMCTCNVVSWNVMIRGYVKCGKGKDALELSRQMQEAGVKPNTHTFVGVLNACASLKALGEGRLVHKQIIESGWESHVFVGNSLIDMYAKCGSIEEACSVFNQMSTQNVVSWNTMIMGYAKCGHGEKALELYGQMQEDGVEPDHVTFVGVLNACACAAELGKGRRIHEQIIQNGWESDLFMCSCLIDMYAKCGSIGDARRVFDKMPMRNVVSWNMMILAYVKCGQGQNALELFQQMEQEGLEPDPVTFLAVLNACASLEVLKEGRRFHQKIIQSGCESDIFVGSCLIEMYAKCGSIGDAWTVFSKMPTTNVVAWNAIIRGYLRCGQGQKGLEIFHRMQQDGVEPDSVTFVAVLNTCASLAALEEGRRLHEQILQSDCQSDLAVGNSLVEMYVKCNSVEDAENVFNVLPKCSVVAWNTMILGYVKCGQGQKALDLYREMGRGGVEPDPVTFVGLLDACVSIAAFEEGRSVHEQIIKKGCEFDIHVGGCLVNMYAQCGTIEDAWRVFRKMPVRNVDAWSAMIVGYVKHGLGHKALELFEELQTEGMEPDGAMFVGVLNACASVGALEEGKRIHKQIVQNGWESDFSVGNSLVDMYVKCGRLEDAGRVVSNLGFSKCG